MSQKEQAYNTIKGLIERFSEQYASYKNSDYNETKTRRDFIDPFFKTLGWDVDNSQGYAEGYREVIHEDAIKISGQTKAPDYSFRIGGQRIFFVEAKKPSVDIKIDISPAYQVRRYAWSAKLPVSILTDFEEFAVYDCRIMPKPNDSASTARIKYYTYKDYLEKWDEIYNLFSKEAVLKGKLNEYIESKTDKRGTQEVDDLFLQEMENWRDWLAHNINLRNPDFPIRTLNDVVQKTIDRIVFLRICEDRGIEPEGQLQKLLNGVNVYARLFEIFEAADRKYNSGLFHFASDKRNENPDTFSKDLKIDDKVLKDIIKRLYYPESPYVFSEIPADILGQVYERFIGKVITINPHHKAVIEQKPEVRKAGGVYYTPSYIVDYIVKNTLGKVLGTEVWGLETGDRGLEDDERLYKKNKLEDVNYGKDNQVIQGPGSMANVGGLNSGNLQNDPRIPEEGNLRVEQPDSKSCGIDSREYSGGAQSDTSEGIHSSLINSERFIGGTRNALNNSQQTGIYNSGEINSDLGKVPKYRKDVGSPQEETPNLNPQSPTPKPLTIEEADKITVLDPACGSGSFLLNAYQYLLDWYLLQYSKNPDKYLKGKDPKIYHIIPKKSIPNPQPQTPIYKLTIQEKKRILINHIYGVDIDPQAVEVTKLSLMLKVLESETVESLNKVIKINYERALPDLSNNIKCGNSLIGSDFFEGKTIAAYTADELYKVNAFDWEKEFPEKYKVDKGIRLVEQSSSIVQMKSDNVNRGGFDVVIGNPPWGAEVVLNKEYFKKRFKNQTSDSSAYFFELAIKLSKNKVGFIVPKSISYYLGWSSIREIIISNSNIVSVLDTGIAFPKVNLESIVIITDKLLNNELLQIFNAEPIKKPVIPKNIVYSGSYDKELMKIARIIPFIGLSKIEIELLKKLNQNIKIKDISKNIFRGLYIPDSEKIKLQEGNYKFINKVPDVKRYYIEKIKYINIDNEKWKNKATHIMVPRIFFKVLRGNRIVCFPDVKGEYLTTEKLVNLIIDKKKYPVSELFLAGIFNSKLPSFYLEKILFSDTTETSRVLDRIYLDKIPLPNPQSIDTHTHDRMVALVEQMMELNQKLHNSANLTDHERTITKRQIDATDEQIDRLVYQLYGLTDEEIAVVEGR